MSAKAKQKTLNYASGGVGSTSHFAVATFVAASGIADDTVQVPYRGGAPCPFRKSYPDVLVMQPSQDRNGDNGARSLDGSMQGLGGKGQPRSNLDSAPYQTKPITAVKVGGHSQAE